MCQICLVIIVKSNALTECPDFPILEEKEQKLFEVFMFVFMIVLIFDTIFFGTPSWELRT